MTYKLAAIVMAAVLSTACLAQAPVGSVGGSGSVNERLAELERAFNARSQSQITQHNQLNSLQREVNELRGNLEEQGHRLEQVIDRQRDILLQLQDLADSAQKRTAEPEKKTSQTKTQAAPEQAAPEQAKAQDSESSITSHGNEQAAYDHAVNLVLQDKDYAAAIPAFARFITQYPESNYVPNSHYWLGQLLFAQKRYDQAKSQFARVVEAYPQSTKRAESLLKLGLIAQQQNDNAKAKLYLEQVLSEYGSSSSAGSAKQALEKL
ncbi:tol-pal system protein YbgF [Oceanisphaera avium]|uniref:Cell division coordinator CpoB n=1 Tax=Oceanisphaera avium TaxID=1903694 RepID=A0A1Y0CUK0_9GAMM|nr:tol-pal system protein YbgF [Oceanisphaera avium]ART78898.1 tol-pal system protein YbgF [Oceanisphaera avium]